MNTSYLPQECLEALNATNTKINNMLELWQTYVSNLQNNTNHLQNTAQLNTRLRQVIASLKHIQDISNKHIETHKLLRNSI